MTEYGGVPLNDRWRHLMEIKAPQKKTVLKQIALFRSLGDRASALDMWSRYKNIITQKEFEQAYGKGLVAYYKEENK